MATTSFDSMPYWYAEYVWEHCKPHMAADDKCCLGIAKLHKRQPIRIRTTL